MKNSYLVLAAMAITAYGQTPNAGIAFQQAGVIVTQAPGGPLKIEAKGAGLMTPPGTAGSPFSATQQSRSVQVLGDGTRIERSESQQVYRDSMGRTRVESGQAGQGMVTILDPVGGFNLILEPATLTARKVTLPKLFVDGEKVRYEQVTQSALPGVKSYMFRSGDGHAETMTTFPAQTLTLTASGVAEKAAASREIVENLPAQNVNGVTATGRKVTMTIPAGEIGNDRPIQVVSESWFSSDLNMVVKSSNSDPRFGDTSFEVTNINRSEPDTALFQVPPGYTVAERSVSARE